MGRALLYYEWHSRWNRLRARLRRLRQPKYLFGAVVGGLYFYWYVFGALRGRGQRRARRRRCWRRNTGPWWNRWRRWFCWSCCS